MLKIGLFSKLSRVSIRMLRYYDEMGLLRPAYIDPNSDYRYYREDQLQTVGWITALRDMGFSLADVRRMSQLGRDAEALAPFFAARRRELEAAQKRIGELNGIFKRLYEDSVSGRITDERFMELSTDYEQEQATLKARAAELQAELGQAQEAAVNVEKFMAVVRKYTSFEELTPTLLREFVEKIVVHECWKDEQGTRHQDIEIYYSFVGKVDLPDD